MTDSTPSNKSQIPPKTDGYIFQHYVVGLIDFLGQRSELQNWDKLPQNDTEREVIQESIKKTFGRILKWRKTIGEIFGLFTAENDMPDWVKDMPDKGELARKFGEVGIKFSHFSDTMVVYSPVQNPSGYLNLHGAFAMVLTLGSAMLMSLNDNTAFRGAIEMGMGVEFGKTEFYGPALY